MWEGNIGDFYRIDERGEATHLRHVLTDPGAKYAFLFALADPKFPVGKGNFRLNDAGKQMALTGFAEDGPMTMAEKETIDFILAQDGIILNLDKADMSWSHLYNKGVWSQDYRDAAAKHSQAIFGMFYDYAERNLTEGLPLLISGGCGLNCDWNRMWRECGLFSSVFVPPVPERQRLRAGHRDRRTVVLHRPSDIDWDVYAGESSSRTSCPTRRVTSFGRSCLARWPGTSSRATSSAGPKAATRWAHGHSGTGRSWPLRSSVETTVRLNKIKRREDYRPIAPICRSPMRTSGSSARCRTPTCSTSTT